jgi:hypothetical protein
MLDLGSFSYCVGADWQNLPRVVESAMGVLGRHRLDAAGRRLPNKILTEWYLLGPSSMYLVLLCTNFFQAYLGTLSPVFQCAPEILSPRNTHCAGVPPQKSKKRTHISHVFDHHGAFYHHGFASEISQFPLCSYGGYFDMRQVVASSVPALA